MPACSMDLTAIHDYNSVCVLYGRYALSDNYLGCIGDLLAQCLLDKRFCLRINGTGGIIENKDFRLFEQRTGNTEPLLLPARYIGSALLNIGIIFLGKFFDKIIRLCKLAGTDQLFVRSLLISPAEVFLDRSGKKYIFLQHHRNFIPQSLDIIVSNINTANGNTASGYIVESGYQLHQGGFGRSCSPEDTYGLTGLYCQVDTLQTKLVRVFGIAKAHIFKANFTVFNPENRVFAVFYIAFLFQYLQNPLSGSAGNSKHHKNH